jgi:hypothetical protein
MATPATTIPQVSEAEVVDLDCWRLAIEVPGQEYQMSKNYALTKVQGGAQGGKVGQCSKGHGLKGARPQQRAMYIGIRRRGHWKERSA